VSDLLAFRQSPPLTPPGASPLLAAMLLAIDLCSRPAQLAHWWEWPAHRDAWWRLSEAEREAAVAARDAAARRLMTGSA
jgi:hypothetical protein